jgi:dTDP-4-amino-4,6-dideoxygalactose transaminase
MTMEKLALNGGKPASDKRIQIAKPLFDEKTIEDVEAVIRSGYLRQGPKTKEFEDNFAEKVGSKYAYAVYTGTAALHVSYLSVVKPGEEIILPSFTFFATASMALHSNAKPIFADIDPDTFLLDPEDVKEKITDKTKSIVPVHLFGNSADMDSLFDISQDNGLKIISDSAQAHGTRYAGKDIGSYDDLNCYSFYPSKTLTTGEGGMVTTNDVGLDNIGRLLRSHGDNGRYNHVIVGLNYRMSDIMGAIGINQLNHLDEFVKKRKIIGKRYREGFVNNPFITPQKIEDKVDHSYSYFSSVLELDKLKCTRDEFVEALNAENISCAVHYPIPLNKQPAIMDIMKPTHCPVSEDISKRIFSLPMHPELTKDNIDTILMAVEKVISFFSK